MIYDISVYLKIFFNALIFSLILLLCNILIFNIFFNEISLESYNNKTILELINIIIIQQKNTQLIIKINFFISNLIFLYIFNKIFLKKNDN